MGVMIDGDWHPDRDQAVDSETGEFLRTPTTFRDTPSFSADSPPATDRYHLYISRACPWAHRTMLVRALKGLETAISVDIVDPVRIDDGWEFSPEIADCTADSIHGSTYLREVYRAADASYTGRVTVPVLWDRETETIVNNESSDIIQIFDDAFDPIATNDITLFPDDLPVEETIEAIYEPINNGVYRSGFAKSQSAYDEAVDALFTALEEWNDRLASQRYLCGDRLTAADLCLFVTLYRFDEVYHTHFKCNQALITEFDHLWGHTREIYQLPGVASTCNMAHVKDHYYRSHTDINPVQLVPVGPSPAFEQPHDRDSLTGDPPDALD